MQFFAFGQGVADTELSVVGNTDDVTGVGVFCQFAFLCQKHDRGRNFQAFAGADLVQRHTAFEVAGTDTHESNSVTVLGIHVGLNFEDESGYLVFARADGAFGSRLFTRGRRKVMQAFQNFLDTEVVDGAAEENRRKRSGQIQFLVESGAEFPDHGNVLAQFGDGVCGQQGVKFGIVQAFAGFDG